MDKQPEIVSFGRSNRPRHGGRWAWLVLVLCLIVVVARLALLTSQRDSTIDALRAALHTVQRTAPQRAGAQRAQVIPIASATAFHTFPDGPRASFSVFAAAVSARPGAAPTLWLYIRGHGQPGQRYGLLGDLCGGQFVTPSDWAEATADNSGNLTIVAPDLPGSPADPRLYVLVYQLDDGVTLGGIEGPLSAGATPFRAVPPC